MEKPARVRKPAVAGTFYPGDPRTLRRDIESFLSRVPKLPLEGRPLVLIEPHAGYMYSGQVAAHGYKLIENLDIRTVVVVSPSHMEYFPFASVFDGDAYETPLGRIAIDSDVAHAIGSSDPAWIRLSDRGHIQPGSYRQEHALEVQLPFLQSVLREFRIVPIVMGDQNWELCLALGGAIAPHLARKDTLVVVSSDLSHFHAYDAAKTMDGLFCELVEEMNPQRLYESIRHNECEACGAGPVIASLIAGQRAGALDCRILHAANSGDVTGERDSVVGYAAGVVRSGDGDSEKHVDDEKAEESVLTPEEQGHLLDVARHCVEASVGLPSDPPSDMTTQSLLERRGAFVTLKTRGRLRGCIGMVESRKPLRDTVAEMARAAALSDPRFLPLVANELPALAIEISVLSPLRLIRSPEEIVVGKHGLVVERGLNRGLLLPQVASEAGWSVETFLGFTCEKAGLPRDAWRDENTRISVFTAVVFGDDKKGSLPRAAKP
jgi:hypothetical protein